MADWNQQVIDEFRANDGRVGGSFEGRTLLLLHHRGAKTGAERVNPIAYQRLSEDSVAVFASKGGAATNPDWYHNILANPDVTVELGTETFSARARIAEGSERDSIWERQKRDWPGFAEYEEKTKGIREIPVVVRKDWARTVLGAASSRTSLSMHGRPATSSRRAVQAA